MSPELLGALVAFAFVSSITPGPNNLMLMASGANHGFLRTLPHLLGVALGSVVMALLVGAGVVQLFEAWPPAYTVLKWVSVTYLLYLAWRIATAAPPEAGAAAGRPFTFLQAAAFQWVNPKAWTMALTAMTVYAPEQTLLATALVALVFGLVNLPSVSCWTLLGTQLRRVLTSPLRLRVFNGVMAVLLVGSLWPVLVPG